MFAVVVVLTVKPGQMAAFLPLMRENAAASLRDEAECHRFDVALDAARPDQVLLYELYTDAAAFEVHLQSAHFKRFDAAVAPMLAGKDVQTWAEVLA